MTEEKKDLTVQDKKELKSEGEHTTPTKCYVPATDIVESDDKLMMYMDMPGVEKKNVAIRLEKNVLMVEGRIDTEPYSELTPYYTEYNIGNYLRKFELSNKIDQAKIEATMDNGVLSLVLPKIPEAQPRTIQIS